MAAPTLRLCPEKCEGSMPERVRICRKCRRNQFLVAIWFSSSVNSGSEGLAPCERLSATCFWMDSYGLMAERSLNKKMLCAGPVWLVLLDLREYVTVFGDGNEMSESVACVAGLK